MPAATPPAPHTLKSELRSAALAAGFDSFGVTTPAGIGPAGDRLARFLAEGCHGDMDWMAANADRRSDPLRLWPDVRSIIMLGASYAPAIDPLVALGEKSRAVVSVYARGKDYHDVLKSKLKTLAGQFAKTADAEVKVFVDTAPLMEKPLAAAAGLGWQGKHTNLVSLEHGSWLFLGAILTTADLPPDESAADRCGTCTRCLDICPTAAMPAPYRLDARRCLAYLSIEHKGHIPREFRESMGNRVFGCDDCLAVCPWNKFAEQSREARFAARPETDNPPLADILALDDAAFRARFAGTPVKRTGRDRVVRNALIAAGNSGDASLFGSVARLATDPSPLVRAMAAWSAPRLGSPGEVQSLKNDCLVRETEPDVIAEWLDLGTEEVA